ncbi:MAG: sigma-70 family RNA polymerase sigma factor [Burkholderiales bacterium]|nr:sigma-70 family RNA polymerase sigma factor [Burkholderiales bacterium]
MRYPETIHASSEAMTFGQGGDAANDAAVQGAAGGGPLAAGPGDADAGLMEKFANGDAAAFEDLYRRHKGGVLRFFLRSLKDRDLAEELAQDVWAALIRARAGYRAEARFATWLYRLAQHRLIDHYRRAKLVGFSSLEDEEEALLPAAGVSAVTPEDVAHQRAAAARLVSLVEGLPLAQREAFLMQAEGGLSLAEIAEATGAGFETVKSRLRYAFARLRDGMQGYLP